MITVRYKLINSPFFGGETLILTRIEDGTPDGILISLDGIRSVSVRLGDKVLFAKDSAVKAEFDIIPEGIVAPTVSIGKREIPAYPFIKTASGIAPAALGDGGYEKMISLYLTLDERIAECEGKIKELCDAVRGHSLFNFIERKKG